MATPKVYNYVSFKIDGVPDDPQDPLANQVTLKLDAPWKLKTGLKADVNVGTCSWREFDKLLTVQPTDENPTPEIHTRGSICLYYSNADVPDLVLPDITLVEVVPLATARIRKPDAEDPDGLPISELREVSYRLFFADWRADLQSSRCGWLTQGDVNKDDADLVSNITLVRRCLQAMRYGDWDLPATLGTLPAVRNLQWHGASAVAELGKILEATGHVFCPVIPPGEVPEGVDPAIVNRLIQRLGIGSEPVIPADRMLRGFEMGGLNRIKSVIITSAPTPIIDTYTSDMTGGPKWYFVASDKDGKYKPLAEIPELGSINDAERHVREKFSRVADKSRAQQLYKECFRFLQLDPASFPPGRVPVLKKQLRNLAAGNDPEHLNADKNSVVYSAVCVYARVAIWTGLSWKNTNAPIRVPVIWMNDQNMIYFQDRIGVVDTAGEVEDFDEHFTQIVDFKIEFSIERWDKAEQRKEYLVFGFNNLTGDGSLAKRIPDEEAKSLFLYGGDNDAVVVQMPSLRDVRINGQGTPGADLVAAAQQRATFVLHATQKPIKHLLARGFIAAELSGRCNEIEYDTEAMVTRFKINQYYVPSMQARREQIRQMEAGGFPGQSFDRQIGSSGQGESSSPLFPTTPSPSAGGSANQLRVKLTSDGGSPGVNKASVCSFTYQVSTLDGLTELGTKIPLTGPGNGWRALRLALSAGTIGLATIAADKTVTLFWANEAPAGEQDCVNPTP